MPRLVVLDGRGYISHCKGIKREFKIFLLVIYWGTVLISKVFLENCPLVLSLACAHRCISAVERIQQQPEICLRSLTTTS